MNRDKSFEKEQRSFGKAILLIAILFAIQLTACTPAQSEITATAPIAVAEMPTVTATLVNATATPTPADTATPTGTPTATKTPTLQPTETPVPPTETITAQPTATETATATPQPTETPSVIKIDVEAHISNAEYRMFTTPPGGGDDYIFPIGIIPTSYDETYKALFVNRDMAKIPETGVNVDTYAISGILLEKPMFIDDVLILKLGMGDGKIITINFIPLHISDMGTMIPVRYVPKRIVEGHTITTGNFHGSVVDVNDFTTGNGVLPVGYQIIIENISGPTKNEDIIYIEKRMSVYNPNYKNIVGDYVIDKAKQEMKELLDNNDENTIIEFGGRIFLPK